MHRAVRYGNLNGLKVLLDAGAVDTPNHSGKQAYHLAWERLVAAPHDTTTLEMVKLLTVPADLVIKMNSRKDFVPDTVVRALIPLMETQWVPLLNNDSALAAFPYMTAAQLQQLSPDQLAALKQHVDPNGDTLMHSAVRSGNLDGLRALLNADAADTVNHSGKRPYSLAWERLAAAPHDTTTLEMVKLLTSPSGLVDKMNWRKDFVPDAVLRALIPLLPAGHVPLMNNDSLSAALRYFTPDHLRELSGDQLGMAITGMTSAQMQELSPDQLALHNDVVAAAIPYMRELSPEQRAVLEPLLGPSQALPPELARDTALPPYQQQPGPGTGSAHPA